MMCSPEAKRRPSQIPSAHLASMSPPEGLQETLYITGLGEASEASEAPG